MDHQRTQFLSSRCLCLGKTNPNYPLGYLPGMCPGPDSRSNPPPPYCVGLGAIFFPEAVAQIFRSALALPEFAGVFGRVTFAIPDAQMWGPWVMGRSVWSGWSSHEAGFLPFRYLFGALCGVFFFWGGGPGPKPPGSKPPSRKLNHAPSLGPRLKIWSTYGLVGRDVAGAQTEFPTGTRKNTSSSVRIKSMARFDHGTHGGLSRNQSKPKGWLFWQHREAAVLRMPTASDCSFQVGLV